MQENSLPKRHPVAANRLKRRNAEAETSASRRSGKTARRGRFRPPTPLAAFAWISLIFLLGSPPASAFWQFGEPAITDIVVLKCGPPGDEAGDDGWTDRCYIGDDPIAYWEWDDYPNPCDLLPFIDPDQLSGEWHPHDGVQDLNYGVSPEDANHDADQIILCYRRDPNGIPITGLDWVQQGESCPQDYELAPAYAAYIKYWYDQPTEGEMCSPPYSGPGELCTVDFDGNLNSAAGGTNVALCISRAPPDPQPLWEYNGFMSGYPITNINVSQDNCLLGTGDLGCNLNEGNDGTNLRLCSSNEVYDLAINAASYLGVLNFLRPDGNHYVFTCYGGLFGAFPFTAFQGATYVPYGIMVNPSRGEVLLSTGLGTEQGLGSLGLTDSVFFQLNLSSPYDASGIKLTTQYITTDRYCPPMTSCDRAILGSTLIGYSYPTSPTYSVPLESTVASDGVLQLTLYSGPSGYYDSAVRISNVYFTYADPRRTLESKLASPFGFMRYFIQGIHTDNTPIDNVDIGFRGGSILLSTGPASEYGGLVEPEEPDTGVHRNALLTIDFEAPEEAKYFGFLGQTLRLPDGSPGGYPLHTIRVDCGGSTEVLLPVSSVPLGINSPLFFEVPLEGCLPATQDRLFSLIFALMYHYGSPDAALLISDFYFSTDSRVGTLSTQELSHVFTRPRPGSSSDFRDLFTYIKDDWLWSGQASSADPESGTITLSPPNGTDPVLYGLRLKIPPGAQTVSFDSRFPDTGVPGQTFQVNVDKTGRWAEVWTDDDYLPMSYDPGEPGFAKPAEHRWNWDGSITHIWDVAGRNEMMFEFLATDQSSALSVELSNFQARTTPLLEQHAMALVQTLDTLDGLIESAGIDGTNSEAIFQSADVVDGNIVLSTGMANDLGTGDTVLDEAGTDYTTLGMTLKVPTGAHTLSVTADFRTTDTDGEGDLFAILIDGEPVASVNSHSGDQSDLTWSFHVKCKEEINIQFYIYDEADDNQNDSAVIIKDVRFLGPFSGDTEPIVQSQDLVQVLDQVREHVTSSSLEGAEPNWSALALQESHSFLLSTGRADQLGLGSSDLCGSPDSTRFGLVLEVPGGKKTLLFKTNLVSVEGRGKGDSFLVKRDGVTVFEVFSRQGAVNGITRWIDVEGADSVELEFIVTDLNDDNLSDTAVIISDMRFSNKQAPEDIDPETGIPPEDQTQIGPVPSSNIGGDPVNLVTGAYVYNKELMRVPGLGMPFVFSIHYNSGSELNGPLGRKWTHSYNWSVHRDEDNASVVAAVRRGDGVVDYFQWDGSAYVPMFGGVVSSLVEDADGFAYTTTSHVTFHFDTQGTLIAISDFYDNTMYFDYEGRSLVAVHDTRGNTASFDYDGLGRLATVNYAGLLQVQFFYDSAGNLESFTKTDNGTISFTYDDAGRLLSGIGPGGLSFITNAYDGAGRVTEQLDGKGERRDYAYADGTVTITDRRGNTETKTFDLLGRMLEWQDVVGARRTYTYNEHNSRTSVTDPFGRVTSADYDPSSGKMIQHVDPAGHETWMSYDYDDPLGSPSIIDEAGNLFSVQYDHQTHQRTMTDPQGGVITYQYSTNGLLQSVTDRMGNTSWFTYSDAGDIESVTNPLGEVTTYEHDALGRMTAISDPGGKRIDLTYDAAGRLTSRSDDEISIEYEYDQNGRMTRIRKLAQGLAPAETTFTYTATGKLESVTDPLGNTYRYEYDAEDKLAKRIDPALRETVFHYDAGNRLDRVIDAVGGSVQAAYDATGARVSVTDPNGGLTSFEVNELGQIVSETDPVGNVVRNAYNERGLISSVTNGRGQTVQYAYDDLGRLRSATLSDNTTVDHQADANGNLTATTTTRLDGTISVTERSFDALDRLISRKDEFGNEIGYEYDSAGNLQTLTYSDGKQVSYSYDTLNRLVTVIDWAGRTTLYTYDSTGNLASALLPDGSTVDYSFDMAQRLTGLIDGWEGSNPIYRVDYTRNELGLVVSEVAELPLKPKFTTGGSSFQVDEANQLVDLVNGTFAYDADGNMVRGILRGVVTEFSFDELGQLVTAGSDTYRYDADGMRIEAQRDGRTIRYIQDPNGPLTRLLEEQDEDGTIIARYVYGLGLISREDGVGNLSVYHFDGMGNTVALTDETGTITDRYAYTPYGTIAGRTGQTRNPFTFAGRFGVMDDGNGLYFMRTRYYTPELMRFLQRDRIFSGHLFSTASLNKYSYANGNPLYWADPNGDNPLVVIAGAVVGAVLGVGCQVIGDLISGEPVFGNWEDYVGAAIGGAIGGALTGGIGGVTGGLIGGAVGGAGSSLITYGLTAIPGGQEAEFDWVSFAVNTGSGLALGGLGGKYGGQGLEEVFKKTVKEASLEIIREVAVEVAVQSAIAAAYYAYYHNLSGDPSTQQPDSLDPTGDSQSPWVTFPQSEYEMGGLKNDPN